MHPSYTMKLFFLNILINYSVHYRTVDSSSYKPSDAVKREKHVMNLGT